LTPGTRERLLSGAIADMDAQTSVAMLTPDFIRFPAA
jgi:hypothetical protein